MKIEPCPYPECNSYELIILDRFQVSCPICGARGPKNENKKEAIAQWNLIAGIFRVMKYGTLSGNQWVSSAYRWLRKCVGTNENRN